MACCPCTGQFENLKLVGCNSRILPELEKGIDFAKNVYLRILEVATFVSVFNRTKGKIEIICPTKTRSAVVQLI